MNNNTTQPTGILSDTAIAKYLEPRQLGDIDLVEHIGIILRNKISPFAEKVFKENPMISSISNSNITVQRTIINRYFTLLLFNFRAVNTTPVSGIIPLLIHDGFVEDWMDIMNRFVIEFVKAHRILY